MANKEYVTKQQEKGVLLLYTTQDEYTCIEGQHLLFFSEVFSRFYPKVKLQYKLYTPRKGLTSHQETPINRG